MACYHHTGQDIGGLRVQILENLSVMTPQTCPTTFKIPDGPHTIIATKALESFRACVLCGPPRNMKVCIKGPPGSTLGEAFTMLLAATAEMVEEAYDEKFQVFEEQISNMAGDGAFVLDLRFQENFKADE